MPTLKFQILHFALIIYYEEIFFQSRVERKILLIGEKYTEKAQLSHNFVKMAYFYKIMCVKKSAFKKVILSDFFKNTSLSCFGQPSGERQTHFAFFSPLSPSLFPFVQSNSFVMRQFLFPYICACVHSGKKRPHSLAA